jgi:hypothetical protein
MGIKHLAHQVLQGRSQNGIGTAYLLGYTVPLFRVVLNDSPVMPPYASASGLGWWLQSGCVIQLAFGHRFHQ